MSFRLLNASRPEQRRLTGSETFISQFPNVLGTDVAGEVYEVGPDVTHVKKGDRVIA